jgi:hypothetical protein
MKFIPLIQQIKNQKPYLYIRHLNKKRPVFLLTEVYCDWTRSKAEIRSDYGADYGESGVPCKKMSGCGRADPRLIWSPDRILVTNERLSCASSFD